MENIKGMERLSDGALAAVAGGSGGDGDELYPAVQSLCSRTRQTVLRIERGAAGHPFRNGKGAFPGTGKAERGIKGKRKYPSAGETLRGLRFV